HRPSLRIHWTTGAAGDARHSPLWPTPAHADACRRALIILLHSSTFPRHRLCIAFVASHPTRANRSRRSPSFQHMGRRQLVLLILGLELGQLLTALDQIV